MKTNPWFTAMAIAFGAAMATACVVSTDDDNDDDISDLEDDDTNTGGTDADDDADDDSGTGGTSNTGGSSGSDATGGSAGNPDEGGTCDNPMNDACAACLATADNGYTDIWDACKDTYPCCNESAAYVNCTRLGYEDADNLGDCTDDPEVCCYDMTIAVMESDDLSPEFYALTDEALSLEAESSCATECFFPAG